MTSLRQVLAGGVALLCWSHAAHAAEPASPGPDPVTRGYFRGEWGSTGETIFEHTRAGLRDPHFGIRGYYASPVPGTLNPLTSDPTAPGSDQLAGVAHGKNRFFDVSFGEHLPIYTLFNVNPRHVRYARGVEFNLDAAAFLLLDYDSQSSGVIDTDFQLGASVDFRPWWGWTEHFSMSVGLLHESTHLGDEYVLSAATIQGQATPAVNSLLPYRANPSFYGVRGTLSVDVPFGETQFSGRVYGGGIAYIASELPNKDFPSEWRVGGELRWTSTDGVAKVTPSPQDSFIERALTNLRRRSTGARPGEVPTPVRGRRRRGAFSVEAAYEYYAKRQYNHVGLEPGPANFVLGTGYWGIQHGMIMGIYNLDTDRSSSNAFGISVDWLNGRSAFGQLTEYTYVRAVAVGIQYYW